MKQFDLKEYLANPSRKVVTRDGKNVRIICNDRKGDYSIIALVENYGGTKESLYTYTKDGYCGYILSDNDNLFFAPEKHEGWINIYRDSDNGRVYTGRSYDSKEDAEKRKASNEDYVTTIKIEWKE